MNFDTFLAIAEQNRFNIVEYLQTGPHSVNEISVRLRLNQPQTSKHLKVLADAGVVDIHPVKQKRYYELSPKTFKELETWIEKYRNIWERRFDRLDRLLEKEKQRR